MNLVFLGDSLTEYFDWQGRFPDHKVINLGIAGEPVEGLLSRLGAVRSAISEPDFIFIMSGINNLAMEDHDVPGTYRKILREMSSWSEQTKIVVQSILPVLLPWVKKKSIEGINEFLRQAAEEVKAEYLDLYPLFLGTGDRIAEEYLLEDGVHLSGRGYAAWSKIVEEFLLLHAA